MLVLRISVLKTTTIARMLPTRAAKLITAKVDEKNAEAAYGQEVSPLEFAKLEWLMVKSEVYRFDFICIMISELL